MANETKSQKSAADVSALLRARNPLLWVVTREEARVESYLMEAAVAAGYLPRTWDVAQGVAEMDGRQNTAIGGPDPGAVLEAIRTRAVGTEVRDKPERGVWILRDLPVWLDGFPGAAPCRQLRNLARLLPGVKRDAAQAIIVISPSGKVPDELAGHATVVEWPLPDRAEVASILDAAVDALPEFETDPKTKQPNPTKPLRALAAPNGMRDAAVDAAVGLSGEEAQACYARSLVQSKRIDPVAVAKEKRRVIAREKVLEWFDPIPGGLDAVGGLENLKTWLVSRSVAYTPEARAYGLPSPRGALLVGISGCGKSLTAKAIATAWGVPLLRLDMGALKSKFVGDSEANIRKAFRVIDAIGRCVVWIDEIEKALQGATSGSADGGVSSDALGAVLSWMQERTNEAFVIATANDVEGLPPEVLRKGRFDDVWFVNLPNPSERLMVLAAALTSYGRKLPELDLAAVAGATDGFTGAEIAALVPDALFAAFADGKREPLVEDLLRAAKDVVPLSQTASVKIKALQEWGAKNARPATYSGPAVSTKSGKRELDM